MTERELKLLLNANALKKCSSALRCHGAGLHDRCQRRFAGNLQARNTGIQNAGCSSQIPVQGRSGRFFREAEVERLILGKQQRRVHSMHHGAPKVAG